MRPELFNSVKEKLNERFSPEKRAATESYKIAYNAALSVAANENQEAVATFSANGQTIFDLRRLNPGTVLRIAEDDEFFTWYATGNKEYQCDIFEIGYDEDESELFEGFPQLSMAPTLEVYHCTALNPYFPVETFFNNITTDGFTYEDDANILHLDIIKAGTPARRNISTIKRETVFQPNLVPQLIPMPKRRN